MTPADDTTLPERIRAATDLLEAVAADEAMLATLDEDARRRLVNACADVFDPDPVLRRRRVKQRARRLKNERQDRDEAVLDETGIRQLRAREIFTTPNVHPPYPISEDRLRTRTTHTSTADATPTSSGPISEDRLRTRTTHTSSVGETVEEQHCYVCKQRYTDIHHFYDQLCPTCAPFNFRKRTETADLSGRVALLTGGRVKIGYQAGIKLLRAGAHLIVTTRFPRDAAERYAREQDSGDWGDRLEIHGLDLRHTPSVEALCDHLQQSHDRLDFIVNNACQTVRRPPAFYEHMLDGERELVAAAADHRALRGSFEGLRQVEILGDASSPGTPTPSGVLDPVAMSQQVLIAGEDHDTSRLFPAGQLDKDLQQVDLRDRNSWRMLLDEVSAVELLEVQLVNAVAPFILNARLKSLMTRTPERDKHIVNVSAVEGQFYRPQKTTKHPHTNMAKAALNMMTRTSATDYEASGIHMNAVDTGWVTDEDPVEIAERKTDEHRFHPPLDIVDGAARIVDPIIDGSNTGAHVWGQFLKDYAPTDW